MLRDYLLNYARPLVYITSLSLSSVVAADASLTMLSDGVAAQLSSKLPDVSSCLDSSLLHPVSFPHTYCIPAYGKTRVGTISDYSSLDLTSSATLHLSSLQACD
ncbi:hypothetical protein BKA70DRAFT_1344437 [Coprinopsis sp. MPI-PUGE-AT-0042]|nr:hypothetical protein BKA70DRAFT_1344437 [Coprinopsis sp. MPI-PUGE-AT-0042]